MSEPICEVCGIETKYHSQVCTAGGSLAAPADSPATFTTLEISWPQFYLRFQATHERTSRVMEFMLKEALEADAEFRDAKNHEKGQP